MSDRIALSDPVTRIRGIGSKKEEKLRAMRIRTVRDLVLHYPFRYRDKREVRHLHQLTDGSDQLASGMLVRKNLRPLSGRRTVLECTFREKDGVFFASFFNMPYLGKSLELNREYILFGRMYRRNGAIIFNTPEIYPPGSERDVQGILPVYRCAAGVSNNDLIRWNRTVLDRLETEEWLPEEVVRERNLCDEAYMLWNLHFPAGTGAYRAARYRDQYDQLYIYLMAIRQNRARRLEEGRDASIPPADLGPFLASLPFELTEGQKQAVADIEEDLTARLPMNRLIQGDVGCGKTVVAEAAIYRVLSSGAQCAFMAPTEILARQHFEKLSRDLEPFGFRTELLVSGLKVRERRQLLEDLASGEVDLLIGTHALIQEDVEFKDLRLLITDEQHRFGVNQRKSLTGKSAVPNVLVMSATPIPRTLQATVFGDMDFTVIRTKPASRRPIITQCVQESGRKRVYVSVRKELEQGHLAYIVAPSIEESEDSGMVSAEKLYEEIRRMFREFRVGLLHGRMDRAEKERIMESFARGELQVLVSTVVIEVGIDVPGATVIVIENSDRFGLAQLHQLRGRVGRNDLQSYCYLINYSRSESAAARMKALTEISDGFEISEEDFRLRGPGDLMGTMQHGEGMNHLISLFANEELVRIVSEDVDAHLTDTMHPELRARIRRLSETDNSDIL